MSGRALCWLAVAVALSAWCDGLIYDEHDNATWPACPEFNSKRIVQRGVADQSVTSLHLKSCNITSLKTNEVVYSDLVTLDLSDNNIEFVEIGAFDSLVSMRSLNLNSNRFLGKELPSSLFRNCHGLYYIDFSNNDMSGTPADLLQELNNLKYLRGNNCSLHEIPKFMTRSVIPIQFLFLNHNQLTRLDDPASFVNLSNLQYLELRFNTIGYLHEDLLKPLTNIKVIDMGSNKIRRIPEQLFQNKSQLWYVNLAKNLIDYIPEKAFLGTKLSNLNLSDNLLVYMSENLFSGLSGNPWGRPQIYFEGNPLPCACLNKLLVKLKQLNIGYLDYNYDGKHKSCVMINSFQCDGPDINYKEFYNLVTRGQRSIGTQKIGN